MAWWNPPVQIDLNLQQFKQFAARVIADMDETSLIRGAPLTETGYDPTVGYSLGKPTRDALSCQSLAITASSLANSEISGHVR